VAPLPQSIGPYRVTGQIGRGATAIVYSAVHPALGFDLAIKVLLAGRSSTPRVRQRFQREVAALRRVRHDGLVEVVDSGEEDGLPWLAMRRVTGMTLEERLRRGPLEVDEVLAIGCQLAEALVAAHAAGLVHRDLKPENVIATPQGHYVISDFGLVKDLEIADSMDLSRTGTVQGTPGYWAPEQARKTRTETTAATDVYGLGAILYALLMGKPPITGQGFLEVVVATLERRPPSVSSQRSDVPLWLARVIDRCLEKDPAARYSDMSALHEALSSGAPRNRVPSAALGAGLLVVGYLVLAGLESRAPSLPASPAATPSLTPSPATSSPSPARPSPRASPSPQMARVLHNPRDGSVLVWIPPGSFRMGSRDGDADEQPVHWVHFERGFYLGKTEVTWRQFRAFCKATGRDLPDNTIEGSFRAGEGDPVFNVDWNEARAYVRWAGLRLPSEAEWEYAARGPKNHPWPWGHTAPDETRLNLADAGATWDWPTDTQRRYGLTKATWTDAHSYVARVGSYPLGASPFGCLDMAGNVWEWARDDYTDSYRRTPRDGSAQEVPGGGARVARGGSWRNPARFCRSSDRGRIPPSEKRATLGFRVARAGKP
jgi:formylglycine-generating enzyme required for sulfatase activity/tRNA A-37 threonylcarbamoyl transferase component Bud32